MAEIEHFCDPADKSHPKFSDVRDVQVSCGFKVVTCLVVESTNEILNINIGPVVLGL